MTHYKHMQNGSALTEFAVLALVMVPAFTMVPLLGKVSNMNQTTVQASRYAAWEMTVSGKSNGVLTQEVDARYFARSDTLIQTNVVTPGDSDQNVLWGGYGENEDGKVNRLFRAGDNKIAVYMENNPLPSEAGGSLMTGIVAVGDALDGTIPGANWDLEGEGLYNARIGVNVGANRLLSGGKDCQGRESDETFSCISRNSAILVDSWSSSDSGQVVSRTKALVPAGTLQSLGDMVSVLGNIPLFEELEGLDGAFGYVDPDQLPPDRYGDLR